MSKSERNKSLARHLRNRGFTPNGQVWADAKKALSEGFTPKQAARLAASTQPAEAQESAYSRTVDRLAVEKGLVAQVDTEDTEFARALETQVREEVASSEPDEERAIPAQAQRVARGEVMRDAKGRIVSREVQEAFEVLASL